MLIDFNDIPVQHIDNFKGGEKTAAVSMLTDENGSRIARFCLAPGASIGLHRHDDSCEMVYVLEGRGKALYDGGYEPIRAGVCHYCPKGHEHSIINDGDDDLVFFAAVPRQ